MTMTRESGLWWFGLISALVAALATLEPAALTAFGIPLSWVPYLRLYAFLAGVGSAWAKTSPFPSKHDLP